MIEIDIKGVSIWELNTDLEGISLALNIFVISKGTTSGIGASRNPDISRQGIKENFDDARKICQGADLIILTVWGGR